MSQRLLGIVLLIAGVAGGCGKEEGPAGFRVSGSVTFDGKPIPAGVIVFTPDLAKQNDGVQGSANIVDGKYDTASVEGLGIAGGPTKITVAGQTEAGKPICKYEFSIDLPKGESTKDIDVPKSAALNIRVEDGP